MLEARRLQWVLNDFGHFDNSLLQAILAALLTRSVPNKCGLALAVWDMLGLSSFDLSISDLFKSGLSFLRRCSNLLFRRTFHCPVCVGEVLTIREWNKVFELGLDYFAVSLTLLGDCIVTDIAFRVDLERECVPCGGLPINCLLEHNESAQIRHSHLLSAEIQRILSDMTFRICTAITFNATNYSPLQT